MQSFTALKVYATSDVEIFIKESKEPKAIFEWAKPADEGNLLDLNVRVLGKTAVIAMCTSKTIFTIKELGERKFSDVKALKAGDFEPKWAKVSQTGEIFSCDSKGKIMKIVDDD